MGFFVYATRDKFNGGVQTSLVVLAAACAGLALLLAITLRLANNRRSEAVRVLTVPHVTKILREKYPGLQITKVSVDHIAKCGDGKASTTDRITFSVEFGEDCAARYVKRVYVPVCMVKSTIMGRQDNERIFDICWHLRGLYVPWLCCRYVCVCVCIGSCLLYTSDAADE